MAREYLKGVILDIDLAVNRIVTTVRQRDLMEGLQWPFHPEPTPDFFFNALVEHTHDLVELSLTEIIRDPEKAKHLERFLDSHTRSEQETADLMRFYHETMGMDWHNHVIEYIGTQTFDVWDVVIEDNALVLIYDGDFRIMEWERDHLRDGNYV